MNDEEMYNGELCSGTVSSRARVLRVHRMAADRGDVLAQSGGVPRIIVSMHVRIFAPVKISVGHFATGGRSNSCFAGS